MMGCPNRNTRTKKKRRLKKNNNNINNHNGQHTDKRKAHHQHSRNRHLNCIVDPKLLDFECLFPL